jgi:hypothetical protein
MTRFFQAFAAITALFYPLALASEELQLPLAFEEVKLTTPILSSLKAMGDSNSEGLSWGLTTENLEQELSRKLMLPPGSPVLRQILSSIHKEDSAVKIESPPSILEQERPVIKHIRASAGIPFPTIEEINFPFDPRQIDREELIKEVTELLEAYVAMVPKMMEIPKLSVCTEAKTVKRERKDFNRGDANDVLYDILYINEQSMPSFDLEQLGDNIELSFYDPKKPNPLSYSARVLSVPCLPYRIRATGRNIFQHQGEDALKNYDDNPNGRGRRIK